MTHDLELTYLGCEGVLIRSAGGSVIIDGLFGEEARGFGVPPDDALDALRHARAPFDGVDLVLATHHHEDHFDAGAVADYLRASVTTHVASTPQAVERLLAAGGADLAPRVHAIVPEEGVARSHEIGGIAVTAFGLSHGKVNYADVQHLGLMVTLGGRTVLHLGDGIIDARTLRAAGMLDRAVDVGVLPFWFLTYPFGKRLVAAEFRPRAIFAVHVRVHERTQIISEIASWSDAVALIEPLSRYRVGTDAGVRKEFP